MFQFLLPGVREARRGLQRGVPQLPEQSGLARERGPPQDPGRVAIWPRPTPTVKGH